MSKICIIGTSNIKHISLISLYTKYFDEHFIPYDIIYIDRYGIDEDCSAENKYCFHAVIKSKMQKVRAFVAFRSFAKRILEKNRYSLLITWQTTSAYLFCDLLLTRYKQKFVINVRDYVAEKNRFIRPIIRLLVFRARMITISSEGFRSFLPNGDYILVNSINDVILSKYKPIVRETKKPYIIGFAGNCRYFRESYKLIDALGNDARFIIMYCGTNSGTLKKYAEEHHIDNVITMPAFATSETLDIFAKFDIVNSAFGNDAWDNRTLMPIRLYTALSMHLPMLVSSNTQLAKEVTLANVGYAINEYSKLGNELYQYLTDLDKDALAKSCDDYITRARKQNEKFYQKLNEIIEG